MRPKHALIGSLALSLAGTAVAATGPFTETFGNDNANWGTGGDWQTFDPLAWAGSGGHDGGGYVTASDNFADFTPGGFPLTLFRGQDNYGSSGGNFEGDWIEGGIIEFSFWVRHDASVDLEYFVRFTPMGANAPSMNLFFGDLVAPNTWTKLTATISPDNEDFVVGGGPNTYNTVFGNLGKIQLGADVSPLAGIDQEFNFDLSQVSIAIPAPGALALFGLGFLTRGRRRLN